MIYSIVNSLMALIATVVIFLGMRCCKQRLDYLDSEQNKRDLLLSNSSKLLFIALVLAVITYFSINLYVLNSNKTVNITALSYVTAFTIFAIYIWFYTIWAININKNHQIYRKTFNIGIENAFGLIIGITYSIILSITINLFFII